jgi:acyl-coenzyme A synthetase/AMP-(fatty) acid ligase
MSEELDRWMRHRGVAKGSVVMLVGEVSAWCMAAVLAIIRAGAVLVPNDVADPPQLRAELIEVARVSLVLCERPLVGLPESVPCICRATDTPPADLAECEPRSYSANNLAAIFFSSGSTGRPKGVRHSATIWCEYIGCHHFGADDGYDAPLDPVSWCDGFWHGSITWYSNWTVLSDVFSGKTVVVVPKATLLDPQGLQELRQLHANTTMYFATAHLRAIAAVAPETLSDLKLVYVWGEKLDAATVDTLGALYPELELFDWLGSSESFLGVHRRFLAKDGLGSARWVTDQDTTVHIVEEGDHTKEITACGTPGILCFARPPGVTMSLGYLGDDALSRAKFVDIPFGDGRGTMFVVGDVAQWAEDADGLLGLPGKLEVLGRNDDQLKIRGQMVNLAHVDAVACALATVADAGSKAVTAAGGEVAVALFVVPAEGGVTLDAAQVRRELRERLPAYAMPAFVERVEALPRNENGKLVRAELPELGGPAGHQQAVRTLLPALSTGGKCSLAGPVVSHPAPDGSDQHWCLWRLLVQQIQFGGLFHKSCLFDERGDLVSYEAMVTQSIQLVRRLHYNGICSGSVVIVLGTPCRWTMSCYLASLYIGFTICPVDTDVPLEYLKGLVQLVRPQHILVQPTAQLSFSVDAIHTEVGLKVVDNEHPVPAKLEIDPPFLWKATSVALVLFSSGSTGTAKGIQLPATFWFEHIGCHCLQPSSTPAVVLSPHTWSDGLWDGSLGWISGNAFIGHIFNGVMVVIVPTRIKLNASAFKIFRVQHAVKKIVLVPSLLRAYLTEPRSLDDLRHITLWGESTTADLVEAVWSQYSTLEITDYWGSSEVAGKQFIFIFTSSTLVLTTSMLRP